MGDKQSCEAITSYKGEQFCEMYRELYDLDNSGRAELRLTNI